MKLVLFSDLHLDAQFAWLGADQRQARRRRQALRETLRRIVDLAIEVKADALLCGGDLYEQERFSPDTRAFLVSEFARLDAMPVYLAPGNHDWYGPASIYRQASWSRNVHVFAEDRLMPVELADGLTLWGAAHRAPADTRGFLDNFKVERDGVNLALFHGSERGWFTEQGEGKAPHAPFSAEQIEQAGLDHALLGHYHRPRDAARHTYPGNPDPLTFGEDGERAAVIATVHPNGLISRERRRVAITECRDVALDISGCASQQDVRDRLAALTQGWTGVARVTLNGEIGPDLDIRLGDLEQAAPTLDGLVTRVGSLHTACDLETIRGEQTVRGQFVRDVEQADLSDDERRRVLLTGLRALGGRDDLEVV